MQNDDEGSESHLPGLTFQLCHLLAMNIWEKKNSNSQSSICKMGIM